MEIMTVALGCAIEYTEVKGPKSMIVPSWSAQTRWNVLHRVGCWGWPPTHGGLDAYAFCLSICLSVCLLVGLTSTYSGKTVAVLSDGSDGWAQGTVYCAALFLPKVCPLLWRSWCIRWRPSPPRGWANFGEKWGAAQCHAYRADGLFSNYVLQC